MSRDLSNAMPALSRVSPQKESSLTSRPSSERTVEVDLEQLKAIDLGAETSRLPSLEKALPRERAQLLRARIQQGGNSALVADIAPGREGVFFNLSGREFRSLRGGELVGTRTGESTVSLEQVSAFAGRSLREMPESSRIVISHDELGTLVNGRFRNANVISPVQLAMFQPPAPEETQQAQEKSVQSERPQQSVEQQRADLIDGAFTEKQLSEILKTISQSSDPKDKEVIAVLVKPAHFEGDTLVPDAIVLQPLRIGEPNGEGQYKAEVTKADALQAKDREMVRSTLELRADFPLDASFSRDLTGSDITITPKAGDSFGNAGLHFVIDRFGVGSPMKTVALIRRTPKEAAKDSAK